MADHTIQHFTEHTPEHTPEHTGEHPVRIIERRCDVAVIGGSAAGLAAALQLARQRRTVIVVDDGTPRNAPAEHLHGYLGRDGATPAELLAVGREEVRSYGGEVLTGRALDIGREQDGTFRVELSGGHRIFARRVLAATGMTDELPDVDGLAERWGRDVIACPFCHGFEVRDQRVVQIVTHPMGLHPAALLRHLTGQLTVVLHDGAGLSEDAVAPLVAAGVPVVRERVARIVTGDDGALRAVELADGRSLAADAVLTGTRFRARLDAFAGLGVEAAPHPSGAGEVVETDPTGRTGVPGVYAAGNLTDPSLQLLPAAAQGSRVGAMIAFSLAEEDLAAGQRPSGEQADWEHRYAGPEAIWSANPNGTLVREVADLPPGEALDVGAGEGADALWLAERGWRVSAADISVNALRRIGAEAERRGLQVECLAGDANAPEAFPAGRYDLVSLQYSSFLRSPDQRGLRNVLGAVAPGGTLLVVGHDPAATHGPADPAEGTRMFDPGAFVSVAEIAAALDADPGWTTQRHEIRDRPAGAVSTHHVQDVVLRARREAR